MSASSGAPNTRLFLDLDFLGFFHGREITDLLCMDLGAEVTRGREGREGGEGGEGGEGKEGGKGGEEISRGW